MSEIPARRVVTPDGVVGPAVVSVDDGVITGISPTSAPVPDRVLVPGFVDLQVNGIDDIDVARADGADWHRLDELLLDQGTTTWLPTLITARLSSYAARLARLETAAERPPAGRPHLAGVHLEGPFLGGVPGAHPPELIIPIDLEWLAGLPPIVRLVTIGPEQPDAVAAIELLTHRGIDVSLGHSRADETATIAALDAGARKVTHLFNGMPPLHHRQPGIASVALTDDRAHVGLIADGVHVHPRMMRLAFAAKPADRIILVSDSVAWRAGVAGEVRLALGEDGAPRLTDGTLAGSALTMDAAFRRAVTECGVGLEAAVLATSTNAARLLGLDDRGVIARGRRADLVALDDRLRLAGVWVGGLAVR